MKPRGTIPVRGEREREREREREATNHYHQNEGEDNKRYHTLFYPNKFNNM
jgi:hypothetical protein